MRRSRSSKKRSSPRRRKATGSPRRRKATGSPRRRKATKYRGEEEDAAAHILLALSQDAQKESKAEYTPVAKVVLIACRVMAAIGLGMLPKSRVHELMNLEENEKESWEKMNNQEKLTRIRQQGKFNHLGNLMKEYSPQTMQIQQRVADTYLLKDMDGPGFMQRLKQALGPEFFNVIITTIRTYRPDLLEGM